MAAFPEVSSIGMRDPIGQRIRFKTLVSNFAEEGAENRKQKWLYPRRNIVLKYEYITKAEGETLWKFFIARKGRYSAFSFFWPEPRIDYPDHEGEYVGTGDGTTTIFNLPCKSSSSRTVYVDGVSQVEGTDYDFTALGGADGADKIEFDAAPTSGEIITIDFTGILKVTCVFAEDYYDFDSFYDRLVTSGIELRGLLNQ